MKNFKKTLFLILIIAIFMGLPVFTAADSPLTSTDFYQVYMDLEVVAKAEHNDLDEEIAIILMTDTYSIDVKMAIINAMGWDFNGQDNANRFIRFLKDSYGVSILKAERLSDEELLCLAYLAALDDYFQLSPPNANGTGVEVLSAPELARLAMARQPNNFTFQLIGSLILSQEAFDYNWCEVYLVVYQVVEDDKLGMNMRVEAVNHIMEYINLYEPYCEGYNPDSGEFEDY